MKYMLLMYANESEIPKTPEAQQAAAPVWSALAEEMKVAGEKIPTAKYGSIEVRPLWSQDS